MRARASRSHAPTRAALEQNLAPLRPQRARRARGRACDLPAALGPHERHAPSPAPSERLDAVEHRRAARCTRDRVASRRGAHARPSFVRAARARKYGAPTKAVRAPEGRSMCGAQRRARRGRRGPRGRRRPGTRRAAGDGRGAAPAAAGREAPPGPRTGTEPADRGRRSRHQRRRGQDDEARVVDGQAEGGRLVGAQRQHVERPRAQDEERASPGGSALPPSWRWLQLRPSRPPASQKRTVLTRNSSVATSSDRGARARQGGDREPGEEEAVQRGPAGGVGQHVDRRAPPPSPPRRRRWAGAQERLAPSELHRQHRAQRGPGCRPRAGRSRPSGCGRPTAARPRRPRGRRRPAAARSTRGRRTVHGIVSPAALSGAKSGSPEPRPATTRARRPPAVLHAAAAAATRDGQRRARRRAQTKARQRRRARVTAADAGRGRDAETRQIPAGVGGVVAQRDQQLGGHGDDVSSAHGPHLGEQRMRLAAPRRSSSPSPTRTSSGSATKARSAPTGTMPSRPIVPRDVAPPPPRR